MVYALVAASFEERGIWQYTPLICKEVAGYSAQFSCPFKNLPNFNNLTENRTSVKVQVLSGVEILKFL